MSQDKSVEITPKQPIRKDIKKPSAEEIKKMIAEKQKLINNNSIIKK